LNYSATVYEMSLGDNMNMEYGYGMDVLTVPRGSDYQTNMNRIIEAYPECRAYTARINIGFGILYNASYGGRAGEQIPPEIGGDLIKGTTYVDRGIGQLLNCIIRNTEEE
jgi:hypothetical protein